MRRGTLIWGLLTLLAGACAENAGPEDLDPGAAGPEGKADGVSVPGLPGVVHRLELDWAAIPAAPGRPNMIAYLPKGLDTSEGVNVVVYLHGWNNCAENLLRAKNGPCATSWLKREAYDLPGQLERSGKNAILLIPELGYDVARSEPWGFAEENTFLYMVWDTLWRLDLSIFDVKQVIVVSHSGGYKAAAAILSGGGMTVNEVWLLDSLYGLPEVFTAWINEDTALFSTLERRFVSLYTLTGGTLAGNQALAAELAPGFEEGVLVDDRVPGGVTEALGRHGVVFKRSNQIHDPLVRVAFGELLKTSALPAKP